MSTIFTTVSAGRVFMALALGLAIVAATLLPVVSQEQSLWLSVGFLIVTMGQGVMQLKPWLAVGIALVLGAVQAGVLTTLSDRGLDGPHFYWPAFVFFVVAGLLAEFTGRMALRIERSMALGPFESDAATGGGRVVRGVTGGSILSRELGRARRHQFTLAFGLLELENWHALVIKRGRAVMVEELARHLATIATQLRATDELAYLGSGRFAVILPHTDFASAHVVLARVKAILLSDGGLATRVGIAQYPEDAETEESLISEAEAALEVGQNPTQFQTQSAAAAP